MGRRLLRYRRQTKWTLGMLRATRPSLGYDGSAFIPGPLSLAGIPSSSSVLIWELASVGQNQVLRQRFLSVKLVTDSIPDRAKRSKGQQENTQHFINCNYSFSGWNPESYGVKDLLRIERGGGWGGGRLRNARLAWRAQNPRLRDCYCNSSG